MSLARRISGILAVVAFFTGVISFFFWGLFSRDVPATIGNLRGTALALIAIVLPVMLVAMNASRRGSVRARLVWLGCLAYIAYNAVMFLFAAHFNPMFLAFTTMLALAFWAIITLLTTIDLEAVRRLAVAVPVRAVGTYLFICLALFAGLWLVTILPATMSNGMPEVITDAGLTQNAVWVLDFAFTFPLTLLGARWLWRRKPWGYVIAGMMVIMLTLETAGIAIDQWFGHRHDPAAPLEAIPLMIAFTGAGALFSLLFLRGVHRVDRAAPGPA